MSLRVAFFGTPEFAVPFLDALFDDSDIEVVAALTQPDKPVGRKQELAPSPVKLRAEEAGIGIMQPKTLKNYGVHDELRALKADAFVVVAYGKLIPPKVLPIPRLGCINVHPSKLPKYRGPAPVSAAIEHGDEKTAVSIMLLDEGMDTGPILGQKELEVKLDDTTPVLEKRLSKIGAPFLVEVLKMYADQVITPVSQDDSKASITKLLDRESGHINWTEPAKFIEQKVRAYTPWPGTYTVWDRNGKEMRLKILKARLSDSGSQEPGTVTVSDGRILVSCGEGQLELLDLQLEGKSTMDPKVFLRGYPDIANAILH